MPEVDALFDDGARRAIRESLADTLFVEAGAGTGKTSELVRRLLALIESEKTAITDVAAITFTEAAAADLRGRVHAELVKQARANKGGWARDALGGLDEATMSTIHGFAQRILGEHPLEVGLPLRFRVLDEIESQLDFDRRFVAFVESLVADEDGGELVAAARAIGMSIDVLENLAFEVDESWNHHRDHSRGACPLAEIRVEVESTALAIAESMERVLGLRGHCDDPDDRLVAVIDGFEANLALRSESDDWIDLLEWCCSLAHLPGGRIGNKTAWSRITIDEARALVTEVETVRAAGVARICGLVIDTVISRCATEASRAAEDRRRKGELRFHDLLVFAHDLLLENEPVRRSVSERFRYILVDEFQDTDPLQLRIVSLIAQDPSTHEPERGKLFFVGDPRQSIYRFRGAKPELYADALRTLVPAGPHLLTENFRSVPGVIDFVNGVFSRLFDPDAPGGAYAPLNAHRLAGSGPTVRVIGRQAHDKLTASARRELEATEVAENVTAAIDEGWRVRSADGDRPAEFGDIVVLVPRRTGLAQLEAAFDARDIPFRADSPSLILRSPEVRDLLACLRAVDAPGDEPALVAALRTSLLAVGDDDLVGFRRSGGAWRLDQDPSLDPTDPVARAIGRLARIAEERFRLGVVGTAELIVSDLHAVELAATNRHADESMRRLRYVLSRARAYAGAGGATIAGFLDWMDGQLRTRVRSAETAIGDGDDSVRILTVHTAKGLEFPIVMLAELGAEPSRQRNTDMVLIGPDGRPEVRVGKGVETAGFAALLDDEKRQADLESIRLCYVAMTRAEDHLVVSLHRSKSSSARPSLAEQVATAIESLDTSLVVDDERAPALAPRSKGRAKEPVGPAGTKAAFDEWLAHRKELVDSTKCRTSVGASELDEHTIPADARFRRTPEADDGEPLDERKWRSPRAASALGRAVHGVLQRVDLEGGADLEELVEVEAGREGCPDEVDKVGALVRRGLESKVVRAAVSSGSYWRELPVSIPIDDGVLDAILDLAYDDGEHFVVVDYKTDALSSTADARAAASRYRRQAGAYALAIETGLGRHVDRFTFLFLSAGDEAVAVDIATLDDAVGEARARITEIFSGVAR